MIIKMFKFLFLMFSDDEFDYQRSTSSQIVQRQAQFYQNPNSARHLELLKDYPFSTNFLYLQDHTGRTDSFLLTDETLNQLSLKRGIDYEAHGSTLFFKTLDMRDDFNKLGYELVDDSKA